MTEKRQCDDLRIKDWSRVRCSRIGVNSEDGKWWCKQHTPSLVKARNAERSARWEAKFKADMEARERADAIAAARAAVVEAAKAAFRPGKMTPDRVVACMDAVNALEALERDHA